MDQLLEAKTPYIKVGDQYISTQFWPAQKCKCKGQGFYGLKAPQGQASTYKMQPNLKCECGSGKKYKKCCQERIQRLSKGGWSIIICHCLGKSELVQNDFVEKLREETKQLWQPTPSIEVTNPPQEPTAPISASL